MRTVPVTREFPVAETHLGYILDRKGASLGVIIVHYTSEDVSVLLRLNIVFHDGAKALVDANSGSHQGLAEHHLCDPRRIKEGLGYLMVQPQLASVVARTFSKVSPFFSLLST